MWTCLAKFYSITSKWGAEYVQDDIGWDKVDRCMCAVKAIALVGDRAFLQAFLKNGCNAKQIGYMDTAYEELCLFPDDGLQQQSQIAMQETMVSHAILPLAKSLLALVSVTEHYGNVAFCVF